MDSVKTAQQDMREAYYSGIPGLIASGCVWLAAGLAAFWSAPVNGMLTLVIGGMLIFPLSIVLSKLLGRSGQHAKTNPLAPLALQGTFWMLLSIPIAVTLGYYQPAYFFSAMLLIIAGRYLTFSTLYGMSLFYLLSAALVTVALVALLLKLPHYFAGVAGGGVELLFALIAFMQMRKQARMQAHTQANT